MDCHFFNSPCPCLKRVLGEVRSLEQAQELRLTDGMPDIGRVLCGWGQILQRSKEWNGDCVTLSAGMMVWVLYAPEDGSGPRFVEGWIPFSISWDLPESIPEGKMQILCLTRFVDARSVSARKIMVRAGISAQAQAYVPGEAQLYAPEEVPDKVELKRVKYPLLVPSAADEKIFTLEEDLDLPGTVPEMEKLILWTLDPQIQEQRVMTDKILMKGSARVHILYEGKDEKLHSWDFSLPIQQFAELEDNFSQEAEVTIHCAVTALEAEQTDGNSIHLRAGLTALYVVEEQNLVEIVEDAYSPGRTLRIETENLEIGRILEKRRDSILAEASVPGDGGIAADLIFLPDFPRQRYLGEKLEQELSGTFQVLYYGAGGELQSASCRWEKRQELGAGEQLQLSSVPAWASEPQLLMGGGDMKLRVEFPMETIVEAAGGMPMVSGIQMEDDQIPDENRPSLILRRAGSRDLWEIAKTSGSTVDAIKEANHLEQEPVPGQMLLIPIL